MAVDCKSLDSEELEVATRLTVDEAEAVDTGRACVLMALRRRSNHARIR